MVLTRGRRVTQVIARLSRESCRRHTVDNAFVQWHSDGTEIMNSRRPAQDGNFCLGV